MSSFNRISRYSCISLLLVASAVMAGKDPTRPPGQVVKQGAEVAALTYRLDSVTIGASRKLAVINGTRAMVGDRVGRARVIAIEPGSVLLAVGDESLRIAISRPLQKKRIKQDKR
ncbi:MAG: hypothetical protein V7739_19275 [Motiliproteus sp.]